MRSQRPALASGAAAVGLLLAILVPVVAEGQTRPRPIPRALRAAPDAGSWEIGGGILWGTGVDLGDAVAELTRNPGTGSGPVVLFESSSDLTSAVGFQAKLAAYLSPSIAIESGVRYARPTLRIRITSDFEEAPDEVVEGTISQYVIDGSFVYHFTRSAFSSGRGVPFVSAGAGYLRDVYDGNEQIEAGSEFHATAGIKFWMHPTRRGRFGVRGEGGVSIRNGGAESSDERRTVPVAGVSLMYLF